MAKRTTAREANPELAAKLQSRGPVKQYWRYEGKVYNSTDALFAGGYKGDLVHSAPGLEWGLGNNGNAPTEWSAGSGIATVMSSPPGTGGIKTSKPGFYNNPAEHLAPPSVNKDLLGNVMPNTDATGRSGMMNKKPTLMENMFGFKETVGNDWFTSYPMYYNGADGQPRVAIQQSLVTPDETALAQIARGVAPSTALVQQDLALKQPPINPVANAALPAATNLGLDAAAPTDPTTDYTNSLRSDKRRKQSQLSGATFMGSTLDSAF